jgi:hydroxymethylbilane synthase
VSGSAALRVGTRASALARTQAEHVAALLRAHAGVEVELVPLTTSGDRGALLGDKSRWVKELEAALLAGEIDVAVHSAKDVPAELPDGLALVGVPERGDPLDALCGADSLGALGPGARVGTSSLRRAAELRALRPDLDVVALRGNVDTRLRKLDEGVADAIVLAAAGLVRLGRSDAIGCRLQSLVPAPGQGTLVLEARAQDARARELAGTITDLDALAALEAERALVRTLGATCHTPLGAHAVLDGDGSTTLRAFLGLPDGSAWVRDELTVAGSPERTDEATLAAAVALGEQVGERLRSAGADELLQAAEVAGAGTPPPASTPEGVRL